MKCGIVNCMQSDNRFLWRCHGTCNRTFHAACVGAQRNHEHILRTFMLPLCEDCQERFSDELNFKKLSIQQAELSANINAQMETNHKILAQLQKIQMLHESLDSIESLLCEVKSAVKDQNKTNNAATTSIKNHMSTLLEDMNHGATKSDVEHVNSALTEEVRLVLNDGFASMESKMNSLQKSLEKAERVPENVLEEIQALSISISNINSNQQLSESVPHPSLAMELEMPSTPAEQNVSGWRMLGSKKHWKPDWTDFDRRQQNRRLQEKAADKARHKQKRRNRTNKNFNTNNNNHNYNYGNNNNTHNLRNLNNDINSSSVSRLVPDKELLAAAKRKFASPPTNPVILGQYINFQKGETINPYRIDRTAPTKTAEDTVSQINNHRPTVQPGHQIITTQDNSFELDPMRPPIVRLTEQSAKGDGRILTARLRDPKIMHIVRLYLAYLKDKEASVCIDGMTRTSIQIALASEGLPTSPEHLLKIFLEVHAEYGINNDSALEDLQSYRTFISSERTHRLQQLRESSNKFYSGNFHKK